MSVKIAINGFGRIGRNALKVALEKGADVVAINDLSDTKTSAHLLKYDSSYGAYEKSVGFDGGNLVVGGKKIPYYSIAEAAKLPWKKLGVDVLLECTGRFTDAKSAGEHLTAGAKKVIISAPSKGDDIPTVVIGVNDGSGSAKASIVSNASCTTNCIAPVMKVLSDEFGVKKALMTTIHSYTMDQRLLDNSHKDLRRARAAGSNLIPTTTGAATATCKTIAGLDGKFDGLSIRVPTQTVSVSDITVLLGKKATKEQVNDAFVKASRQPRYAGVLGVSSEPLVSSDFKKNSFSAIVDLPLTYVVDGDLVKVIAWYDNEWGYANRLVELAMQK
ncbi:type I glyceraldehyde-3-phosphate dehydrogenase [Candidatus Micrarchaeota archaeon]|nr:type I glyceraldehyde-3-phosphate dehydrogenase [Candidatus Micrarchaeota archaeon]